MMDQDANQETQSIFQTIRIMLLSFSLLLTALLAVVAFVGVGSLNDLRSSARSVVESELRQLLSEKSDLASKTSTDIDATADAVKALETRLTTLTGRLDRATNAMAEVEAGLLADVGAYLRLAEELQQAGSGDLITDQGLRERARAVLESLLSSNDNTHEGDGEALDVPGPVVMSEILYNAAGTASRLQMPGLATALAQGAWTRQQSPEYETRFYRSQMEAGEIDEEQGLSRVIGVLDTLESTHNMHLTLSETFNVAVGTGRLEEAIGAFDRLIARFGEKTPSYAHVVRAEMKLLVGFHGDVEAALEDIGVGLEKLSTESPNATWFDSSVSGSRQLLVDLGEHPAFEARAGRLRQEYAAVLAAKTESVPGVGDLGTLAELLGVLSAPEGGFTGSDVPSPADLITLALGESHEVVEDGWRWFAFFPETDGRVVVEASTDGKVIDPMIRVYQEGTLLLGSDDDSGEDFGARMEFAVTGGVGYSIGVGPALGTFADGVRGAVVSVRSQ